ncbi:MAG: NupC/NupG family nucleoside CNT transporter [Planctomycetes bacterium]|nr:NupC/NupG family nucleoside CNT transporter [Planctomycetota bacterium]
MAVLQSLLGILVIIGFGWLISLNRKQIRWRPVLMGLVLQWLLALLVLKTPMGEAFFDGAQRLFKGLINVAKLGAKEVVGSSGLGLEGTAPMLALLILVTVIFFSSLFSVLHHLGVVRLIVGGMAKVMARLMGTSGAESTSAAANIFVGQTEAPLLVRPYLPTMTRSEIGAIMTVGFATVAGGVFALYVGMLQDTVPGIAGHLLAATVMSAPVGLGFAKLVFPETEEPQTLGKDVTQPESEYANLVDAAASGAADGMRLALNIIGMLIAFLGLLELVNWILDWLWDGQTLQNLLGYVMAPVAWLLGVPMHEARDVGTLLGVKIAVNEYIAYGDLMSEDLAGLSDRSRIIASYALCGFANFSSIAIQIGGLGGMAPKRRGEISSLGLRAMAAGACASFLTAATAAIFLG